jgi:hypothetical protein
VLGSFWVGGGGTFAGFAFEHMAGDVVQVGAGFDAGKLGFEIVNGDDLPSGDGVNAAGDKGENALLAVANNAFVYADGADLSTAGEFTGVVSGFAIGAGEGGDGFIVQKPVPLRGGGDEGLGLPRGGGVSLLGGSYGLHS